jgi:hypothetical protein
MENDILRIANVELLVEQKGVTGSLHQPNGCLCRRRRRSMYKANMNEKDTKLAKNPNMLPSSLKNWNHKHGFAQRFIMLPIFHENTG